MIRILKHNAMKKTVIILFMSFLSQLAFTQTETFYISYNNFSGGINKMIPTYDNCLALLSMDSDGDPHRKNVVKIDTMGNVIWQTKIMNSYTHNVFGIIQTTDSGFVALLDMYPSGGVITVVKLDKNGNYNWSKKFNYSSSNQSNGIAPLKNGGMAFVGGGCSGNNFIIRLDAIGNMVWKNQYLDFSYVGSYGEEIVNVNDTIIVAGASKTAAIDYDLVIYAIDTSGNSLWHKTFPLPGTTIPKGIVRSLDGGFTVTGYTDHLVSGFYYPFLIHTDALGNLLWAKYYSHNLELYPESLVQLDDGSYAISGTADYTDSRGVQMLNFKTDVNGNLLWAHSAGNIWFSGGGLDQFKCSATITGKNYYAAGFSDATIVSKYDANGFATCSFDTLDITVVPLTITPVTATISVIPLTFSVDTTNFNTAGTGYVRNVLCATKINDFEDESELNIYPNPFNDKTTFLSKSFLTNAKLTIYDLFGNSIVSVSNISGNSFEFNRNNMIDGIYFYRLVSDNNVIDAGRLIIN